MDKRFGWFEEIYLRLDRRVLGVFRWSLGAVLLYDLLRRWPDAALLWSSDGVLSSATLQKYPQSSTQFSLLLGLASGTSVKLAFAALGLVFLLYAVGLFTSVMQVVTLIGYTSLNARNFFFEDGGTSTTILLLGWTLLLPLGERFSLDALRRDARLPNLKARVAARAKVKQPLITLAALIILLQAAAIYWLNAAHKSGHTWRAGEAVHLVLWQHRVNTPLAVWFAAHEPSWFSPLASWSTKRTEFLLPLLLLWPSHPTQTRSAAFVLALMLHGGIALSLTLGPFSYAMICLVWLAVPGLALDALTSRGPRKPWWRLARQRARAVRALRRFVSTPAPKPEIAPSPEPSAPTLPWWRGAAGLREGVLVLMLVVEIGSLLSSNQAIPKPFRANPGVIWRAYKPYLRGFQGWSMFAPNAPEDDGQMVVDAVTASGRHIDPFTGNAPDWEQIRRGTVPHRIALSDYFLAMRDTRNTRYRRDLARYLKNWRGAGPNERLRSAEFWWVSYTPPPRGSYVPGPIRKQKLWRTKL